MRGSDAIVQFLISHGVKDVFGVPGDTSMNLHDAFWQRQTEINHITCRDERNAVYMADAYARIKNTIGVVEVPSGGGALYAVPGVSEANISSIPLLCLASDIAMSSDGTGALTDVDQEAMFKPLSKWTTRIKMAAKIPLTLRKAFRMATMGRPGAVHVAIPENIHGAEVEFAAADLKPASMENSGAGEPPLSHVEASASYFQKAAKAVIIAGGGVHLSFAHAELEGFAARFGIPVATTINGKGSVSEFLPISAGTVGANGGSEETNGLIKEADLVMVLGSRLNNVTTMGKDIFSHNPEIIQVDIAAEMLDANVRNTLSITSDIKFFLCKLDLVLSPAKEQISEKMEPWLKQVQQVMAEKRARISKEINKETKGVNPAKIFDLLERLTDADTVFVADAGTATPYLASFFRLKKAGRKTIFPRAHGSLGYALPAAI
jgi:acetolactate synthase I/II/III large subunit